MLPGGEPGRIAAGQDWRSRSRRVLDLSSVGGGPVLYAWDSQFPRKSFPNWDFAFNGVLRAIGSSDGPQVVGGVNRRPLGFPGPVRGTLRNYQTSLMVL